MPEESLDVINCVVECFPKVVSYIQLRLVALSVMNKEPGQVFAVELDVDGTEVDVVGLDGLGAVAGDEDLPVLGVGEYVIAVVVGMVKELVDGGEL